MEWDLRYLIKILYTKAFSKMGNVMEQGELSQAKEKCMRVSLSMTRWMEQASLSGQMVESMKETGSKTKSKEKVSTFGQMVKYMMGNSKTMIAMGTGFCIIQTVKDSRVIGEKEKNMVLDNTSFQIKPCFP